MTTQTQTQPQPPAQPLNLSPDKTYLHITTPTTLPPNQIPPKLVSTSVQLKYIGQVGELKGENIYEVIRVGGGDAVRRDGEFWLQVKDEVLGGLKGLEGVKGVKVLDNMKRRVKRDEF